MSAERIFHNKPLIVYSFYVPIKFQPHEINRQTFEAHKINEKTIIL